MTFEQIMDEIEAQVRHTDATSEARVKSFVNQLQQLLCAEVEFDQLIREGIIRLEADRFTYPLPYNCRHLIDPLIIPNQNQPVYNVDNQSFREAIPDPTATGTPYLYKFYTKVGVMRSPATLIRLVSSSASDTQVCTLYGEIDGKLTSEGVTLTGTTAVLSTKNFTTLDFASLASAAVGTITATGNSTAADATLPTVATAGAVTLFTITAGNTEPTNIQNPASLLRIKMDTDDSGDRNKTMRVEGEGIDDTNNIDGILVRETTTTDATNSTTQVNGTVRFTKVYSLAKGWAAVRNLLVIGDPSSRVLAYVAADVRTPEYKLVQFYSIPDGTESVRYTYRIDPPELINDNDVPVIPERYHLSFLVYWGVWAAQFYLSGSNPPPVLSVPEFQMHLRSIGKSQRAVTRERVIFNSGRRRDRGFNPPLMDPEHYANPWAW